MWIRALMVIALVAACGDEKQNQAQTSTESGDPAAGDKAAAQGGDGDSAKPVAGDGKQARVAPKAADAKPSCRMARYTKPVDGITVDLKLAIEGEAVPLEFDPSKSFGRSKVWDKPGLVKSACGAVRPRNGKMALTLFTQLHRGGKHVLRMQMINIPGGYHLLSGGSIAAVLELNGAPVALSFQQGKYTIEPKPVAPGAVSIVIENGAGILLGTGNKEKFTFSGKIAGTFSR